MERTLVLIKPDATARNLTGAITQAFEDAGLAVVARRRLRLAEATAGAFYAEHRERPFYASLVAFMTSGPIEALALAGDDAIARVRALMGATNPAEAADGTLRARFAESIERNAVHGSDSATSAAREVPFFFAEADFAG